MTRDSFLSEEEAGSILIKVIKQHSYRSIGNGEAIEFQFLEFAGNPVTDGTITNEL